MKLELVMALFTVWERSLLSHLLVGTWIQPTYLTFPGLGWGRNMTFNTLDKAYSSRFSDIIPRLASLAEQGRPQCSKAGESRSSCSLASSSVHVLACSRVCWKLNLQKTLLRWRNREWPRNLLLRDGVLGCRSLHPVTTWTHKLNSYNEASIWMGVRSTTQFVFMIRWSLLLVWPPKLLTPGFIYHSLGPLRTHPLLPSSFHISSLSFSLYPSGLPEISLDSPDPSRYCLVCFHHTAPKTGLLSLHGEVISRPLKSVPFFSVCNWGSAQNVNEWKIWADDWVNERIISVYFKFSELTQAWDREES